jgi:tRNA A-37 threonylcarbamoyl transferase component Bud32
LIQVGQVLDKYELLERVGQGGMAIVYRGIDRQLKRTVAVKILHKHLSDYQEARDRFEREAQAVAKLRHENILEIFDYSAKEGFESYIVTEFIDGQTLKQFITERPITFPEIGGMIILQVCRALAHAHAASILHRDVKPENIMIRHDGVVKLMDFGISHMVDLERLTVTGQLLGSPAYMAPEHVEGRPLDFRTDVFAAGIVLYQLTVGKLPFEGKNPHEVLKRIAECRFLDPRQANPRIGNRLGRIILKAMAASPDDRYAAIGEMVLALESYLDESGLSHDKIPAELARYFAAPASYEEALKTRLIDTLTRTGQAKLASDERSGALDVFDRVLTIDPNNERVLAILDRLNRRARLKIVLAAVVGVGVLAFGGYEIHERAKGPPAGAPNIEVSGGADPTRNHVVHEQRPVDAAVDAQQVAIAPIRNDARQAVTPLPDAAQLVTAQPDASIALDPVPVQIAGVVAGSTYTVDGGAPIAINGRGFTLNVKDRDLSVIIQNPVTEDVRLTVTRTSPQLSASQRFRPGTVTAHCAVPNVSVSIDGKIATLDQPVGIFFAANAISSNRVVHVEFTSATESKSEDVQVDAAKNVEVKCALH